MPKSKTVEYREFLKKQLDGGAFKAAAARALKAKHPRLSLGYCVTLVYQGFPGQYNSNYDRTAKRDTKVTKKPAPKKSAKPAPKKAPTKKPAKVSPKKATSTSKALPKKAPAPKKTGAKRKITSVEMFGVD
jgi:hypothetical protein